MTDQPFILALDIGTSSTRAILYDARGQAVPGVDARQIYGLTTSHEGEASIDADKLLALVASTIDDALAAAGERARHIAAVATSTFWHTLVPLDSAGHPLLPLLTWEDTRPRQAAVELRALLDEGAVHRSTGARLHASYWPAKIRWLVGAYPEIAARTARYVSFGEYLHERFLGRAVCSLSMASGTGLLNTRARTWDQDLLACLRLPAARLPELGDASDALRGLASPFAARWPALERVPWFPAIGDGAAANLGSQCADVTIWAVTMGTSSAMRVVVPPVRSAPEQGLWLYFVDRQRALLGGALSEGGNVLAWLKNTLRLPDLIELEQEMEKLEPTAHGLTVLPQLAGERSPGWHPHATMTITGLTSHTTPLEITRAGLEAVIFQLAEIYDQLIHALRTQVTRPRLIVNGGTLLRSPLLRQMLADTLACPLELSASEEASARGVALLALEALGILPNLAQFAPPPGLLVQPDSARHAIYRQARQRQQALYATIFGAQEHNL